MRKRVTVSAVASALALSAFAVPGAAQADESVGDTKITKVVVNGGSNIGAGPSPAPPPPAPPPATTSP
ncbi:hypothetical protein [Streptomyces cyslabdanicus]|uniref:hypothetical protein n=1 Tax=Streptomyces cyslabdanicus TaxID=1470456 RepID=UPI0040448FAB